MMALKTRTALPVVSLLAVAVLGVSACGGGGVPGNSVATVGDQTIKRDTFDHWMKIIAVSQAGQPAGLARPLEGARQHQRELPLRKRGSELWR